MEELGKSLVRNKWLTGEEKRRWFWCCCGYWTKEFVLFFSFHESKPLVCSVQRSAATGRKRTFHFYPFIILSFKQFCCSHQSACSLKCSCRTSTPRCWLITEVKGLFALIIPGAVGCVSSAITTSLSFWFVKPMEVETSASFPLPGFKIFLLKKRRDLSRASPAGEEAPNPWRRWQGKRLRRWWVSLGEAWSEGGVVRGLWQRAAVGDLSGDEEKRGSSDECKNVSHHAKDRKDSGSSSLPSLWRKNSTEVLVWD